MTLVIQRVRHASVEVEGVRVAGIGRGLLVLAGVRVGDEDSDAERAARKVAELRVFADADGKMNLALAEIGGAVLAVSQFTLAGSIDKGRRPGFEQAMKPPRARDLFERFVASLRGHGVATSTGVFAADMQVGLVNDGPVTFVYDTRSAA